MLVFDSVFSPLVIKTERKPIYSYLFPQYFFEFIKKQNAQIFFRNLYEIKYENKLTPYHNYGIYKT